jgi:sialidase-1
MNRYFSGIFIVLLGFSVFNCYSSGIDSKGSRGPSKDDGKFRSLDLFVSGENNVVEYRIPSIIKTNKGTLIAVCDARVDRPGDAPNNIDLVMKKSSDGGKTWTKSKVIVGFPDNDAACDPSLVADSQTGTIWLAYDYAIADPQGADGRILRIHLIKSNNEGENWSVPVELTYLTRGKEFWLQNGPGVGLYTDGTIVFPMYSVGAGGKGKQQTMLVYSRDHGKTWLLSNGVGEYNPEPQVVSLPGSRIMANMRRPHGKEYRQVSVTSDMGNSWSEASDDHTLIEPGCQGSIINYSFNNKSLFIFSNPADIRERRNMVVRVSSDEGKSWPKEIPVFSGSSGYSCLVQLPDGNIGLLYERDEYKKIVFAVIPAGDLY